MALHRSILNISLAVVLAGLVASVPASGWAEGDQKKGGQGASYDGRGEGQKTTDEKEVFGGIAADLLDGLNKMRSGKVSLLGGRRGAVRIALWPFDGDEIPIPESQAEEFNRILGNRLRRQSRRTLEFVARDGLRELIREVSEYDDLGDVNNPVATLVQNAKVDVLLIGRLRRQGDDLRISYEAFRVKDATQVASSDVYTLAKAARTGQVQLTLNQAASQAARHFADGAANMTELRLAGLRFQTTGVQTSFGGYLEELVSTKIQNDFTNILTGRKLKTGRARLAPSKMAKLRTRGMMLKAKELKAENFDDRADLYVLTGTYWEAGDALDIRLSLKNGRGESVAWQGTVRTDSLPPGIAIRPEWDLGRLAGPNRPGPIEFDLSSDHGKDPVYRIGDKLNLVIRVNKPAWLYCYYRQNDNKLLRIIPNQHHREARLVPGRAEVVPGEMLPFEMTFQPPAGVELVKCFATGRNVETDLPDGLRGYEFKPLPKSMEWKLPEIFRRLPDAQVSEASLIITLNK